MLRDAGASHVIVGHSERRTDHGETDAIVRAKAEAAWRAGLLPIVCIGETLAEREAGKTLGVLETQLKGSVPAGATAAKLVVAYEPVWAIGTGKTPTTAEVAAAHAHIRKVLGGLMAEAAAVRLLYGGSVKGSNAAELAGGGRRRRRPGRRGEPQGGRIFGYRQGGLKRLEAPAWRRYPHLTLDEMDAVRGFLHDWRLVLLIIHVGVTAAMIVVILLQRSEGGGLGMGRTDALFSVRGQANVLSRMTAIFAGMLLLPEPGDGLEHERPGARVALDHGQRAGARPPRRRAGRRRAAPAAAGAGRRPRRPPRRPARNKPDDRPFPPPKLLRREDIPMAAPTRFSML